jgi:hypothetical protein
MQRFKTHNHKKKTLTRLVILALALQSCYILWLPAGGRVTAADIGWPRELTKDGVRLVYYQPQIDEWKNYRDLTGRMAVSLTPKGGQPALGVATLHANTLADLESRTVVIRDIEISSARFPSLENAAAADQMVQTLRKVFPAETVTMALDRLTSSVERGKAAVNPVAVKTDPPQIYYSKGSAILLLVEGEPVKAKIEKTDLEFVVNANWDIFFDHKKKNYYLLNNQTWLTSKEITGPWAVTTALPKDMAKLPPNENWDDVKKAVPARPAGAAPAQVFFSNTPAELITFKGEPVFANIPGTRLVYAKNTESDIFVHSDESQYYFLVSGRWFRAKQLDGPWSYAGNDLPQDFVKIPRNSPKSHVLASIPGTQEAEDAVMLAQVPTTAIINRAEAEAKVKVYYDGEPQFKAIEGTSLQYATNSQDKIIKYGDLYYLCFQAVWFMSASPQGPWKTADSVPKEIYTIPPSSPVHNVTYVTQSKPTSTTVESSSTSGYIGMFVIGMAVGAAIVYGTGYYYPPYFYHGAMYPYPIYRPYPYTYGVHAVYNPYTGGYRVGHAAYGPYGAVGGSAWYNPATGRYGRAATAQTWYGGRTVAHAYNPYTGGYAATRQGHSPYAQWGSSVAVRGDEWARTGHVTTERGTIAGIETSTGKKGVVASGERGTVAAGGNNNVYAGKDGNVYKRDPSGDWHKYENGGWNQMEKPNRPSTTPSQTSSQARNRTGQTGASAAQRPAAVHSDTVQGLNHDAQARQRGTQQTQRFQNYQRQSRSYSGSGRSGGRRR